MGGDRRCGVEAATEELEQASAAVGQHLSAATAGGRTGSPGEAHTQPGSSATKADREDVIDAGYEVKG